MTKGWAKRVHRGRLGWLSRIDGVEKPVLLVGLGLVLFRVWRAGDPSRASTSRWRSAVARLRQQIEHRLGRRPPAPDEPAARPRPH